MARRFANYQVVLFEVVQTIEFGGNAVGVELLALTVQGEILFLQFKEGNVERAAPRIYGFKTITESIHISMGKRFDGSVPARQLELFDPVWAARAWNQSSIFG